ncbi:MAG: alcohol dehydrogenase catalytic domain-containing protein, partial [Anaerolineae bacterium]|nr:alcohol dehydrogenase catalytic domain-containing protein [Anaerolineae bacterium]
GLLELPRIPGHEWSGTVTEVGEAVTKFKPGDRVTGDTAIGCGVCEYCLAGKYNLCPTRQTVGILRKEGAFAEQLVMPERHLYLVPDSISMDEATLTEPAAVAV